MLSLKIDEIFGTTLFVSAERFRDFDINSNLVFLMIHLMQNKIKQYFRSEGCKNTQYFVSTSVYCKTVGTLKPCGRERFRDFKAVLAQGQSKEIFDLQFFHHSNPPGLKKFCFQLRFRSVIRIFFYGYWSISQDVCVQIFRTRSVL